MEAEPAKTADPLSQLVAAVGKTTIELGNVRRELADERDTRERQIEHNATLIRKLRMLTAFDIGITAAAIILGLITGNLLVSHNSDLAAQKRRDTAAAHVRAVQQCQTTNEVRTGIREANDTTAQVIASFFPPNAPPAAVALLHQAEQRYAASDAAIPNLDCTKVP